QAELNVSIGNILACCHAGDAAPCVRGRDAVAALTDHDDNLDFPVHPRSGELYRAKGPKDCARKLGEDQGNLGDSPAHLLDMLSVVRPDAEHLPGMWTWWTEFLKRVGRSTAEVLSACPRGELAPVLVEPFRFRRKAAT